MYEYQEARHVVVWLLPLPLADPLTRRAQRPHPSTAGDGCGDVRRLHFDPLWRSYTWGRDLPSATFRRGQAGCGVVIGCSTRCAGVPASLSFPVPPSSAHDEDSIAETSSCFPSALLPLRLLCCRHMALEDLQQLLMYRDPEAAPQATEGGAPPRTLLLGISSGGTVAVWDLDR